MHGSPLIGIVAALAVAASACAVELPPVQLESDHVRLRSHRTSFCAGTIDWLEHHYLALSGFLDVELPRDAKIEVIVVADPDELVDACGSRGLGVDGCADGTSTFSLAPFHPHELVHAYASLLGDPPFFFQEGLAEVIGCGEKPALPPVTRPADLRPLLTTAGFRALPESELASAYGVAAELTRHLFDVHGRDAYLAFYASVGRSASVEAIDAAMLAHFGAGLETVLASYHAAAPRSPGELCLRVAECATPDLDEVGAPLACGAGVHPLSLAVPNLSAMIRSVPAVGSEGLRFYGAGLPAVGGSVSSCNGALEDSLHFVALDPGAPFEVWANPPPGDYTVNAWKSPASTEPAAGSFTLERVTSPPGAGCSEAGVRVVPPGTAEITAFGDLDWLTAAPLPEGRARMVFAFELSEDVFVEPIVALLDPPLEGETAWLCEGGCPEDPEAVCEAVDLAPAVAYVPFLVELRGASTLYLVVDGTPSETGFSFRMRLSPRGG